MNAIELLKKDHERVLDLFKSYEQAGDRAHAQKKTISDKIFQDLEAHTQVEEEILYPAAREAFSDEDKHLLAEAYEEHAVAKTLIVDMKGMTAGEEGHDAKMKVLQENIEHHIEEEHKELFPKTRQNMGSDQLNELGRRMAARKQQFIELRQPLGASLVKMVTKALGSLTNGQSRPQRKAATRKTAARAAAKKTASRTRRKGVAMAKGVRTKAVKKLRQQTKAGRPRRRAGR